MKKMQPVAAKEKKLAFQKETILSLAVGGSRVRIPIGYTPETDPIYGPDGL